MMNGLDASCKYRRTGKRGRQDVLCWEQSLSAEWRWRVIAPTHFEGYRDHTRSAVKTVGFSLGGHRCYYAFRYALLPMHWGASVDASAKLADSRQLEAWLLFDGRWLVSDTLKLGAYTLESGVCIEDECPC